MEYHPSRSLMEEVIPFIITLLSSCNSYTTIELVPGLLTCSRYAAKVLCNLLLLFLLLLGHWLTSLSRFCLSDTTPPGLFAQAISPSFQERLKSVVQHHIDPFMLLLRRQRALVHLRLGEGQCNRHWRLSSRNVKTRSRVSEPTHSRSHPSPKRGKG